MDETTLIPTLAKTRPSSYTDPDEASIGYSTSMTC